MNHGIGIQFLPEKEKEKDQERIYPEASVSSGLSNHVIRLNNSIKLSMHCIQGKHHRHLVSKGSHRWLILVQSK